MGDGVAVVSRTRTLCVSMCECATANVIEDYGEIVIVRVFREANN